MTWRNTAIMKKLEAFEIRVFRKILNISRIDRISNNKARVSRLLVHYSAPGMESVFHRSTFVLMEMTIQEQDNRLSVLEKNRIPRSQELRR